MAAFRGVSRRGRTSGSTKRGLTLSPTNFFALTEEGPVGPASGESSNYHTILRGVNPICLI